MKHSSRAAMTAGFLALTLFGVSRAALADIAFDRDVKGTDAYTGVYNGGEFKVTTFDCEGANLGAQGANVRTHANLSDSLFQTFCLERNEYLRFDGTLYDCEISDAAISGGIAGGDPDPLSNEAAYLFYHFWRGDLSDYNYAQEGEYDDGPIGTANTGDNSTRGDSATSLQLALWYFEQELGTALQTAYDNDDQAKAWVAEAIAAGWTDIGNVRVVNVFANGSDHELDENYRQDVLVVISAVPLPPAALLGFGLMSAVGALDFVRRRRRALA